MIFHIINKEKDKRIPPTRGESLPCICKLPLWLPQLAGIHLVGYYLQKYSLRERLKA